MEPLYSFEISRSLLVAMALFQSEDETRFILNSTKFEIVESNDHHELTLVATDGRRMAIHRGEILTDNLITGLPATAEFSVDLSGVKKIPKARGLKAKLITCSVFAQHAEFASEKYKYKADFVANKDGEAPAFPKWRQVIPTNEPSPNATWAVNFELLDSFGIAAKLLNKTGSGVVVRSYGKGGALTVQLTECKEFFGILMPLSLGEDGNDAAQQDWVKAAQATEEKIGIEDIKKGGDAP